MKLLSTKELAQKWGVDQSRILRLAYENRIEGATRVGNHWMFPPDAKKPMDGRTKTAKAGREEAFFRFPLYVNFEEDSYLPPLSDEEKTLRRAQLAFQACRFGAAKELLVPLSQKAVNRYVRLSALYHCLYIAMFENNTEYDSILFSLNAALSEDFPYKKEMLTLRYGFDADNTAYKSVLEEFSVDSGYIYHPSAYYTLMLVSFIPIQNGDFSLMSRLRYETYELLCQQMEREGYFLEAQKLHYLLSVVYHLQNKEEKMEFHIRRGLQLAKEHELYFAAGFYARWYQTPTQKILRSFPSDFSKKVQTLGKLLQENQARFEESRQKPRYMSVLSGKEFEYAFLANQGYTNREIAKKQKTSEKTVSKIYNEIYDKLSVKNKQELVDMINCAHKVGESEIKQK